MDTFTKTRRLALWTALMAATAACSSLAQAHDFIRGDAPQMTVRYSDQDVSTIAAASAFYRRLEHAAHFVCGDEGRSFGEQMRWRSCVHDKLAEAVTAVHSPTLSAIEADGGRSLQTALRR